MPHSSATPDENGRAPLDKGGLHGDQGAPTRLSPLDSLLEKGTGMIFPEKNKALRFENFAGIVFGLTRDLQETKMGSVYIPRAGEMSILKGNTLCKPIRNRPRS